VCGVDVVAGRVLGVRVCMCGLCDVLSVIASGSAAIQPLVIPALSVAAGIYCCEVIASGSAAIHTVISLSKKDLIFIFFLV